MSELEPGIFFFDIFAGEMIVGQQAYDDRIESGVNPADVVPLRDALLRQPGPTIDQYPRMDVRRLTLADSIAHTAWLGNEVLTEEIRFTEDVYERANRLGLGASIKKLKSLSDLSSLYEEAELRNVYKRGIYDEWTRADFVDYVGDIADKVPKTKSLRERINKLAKDGKGPSNKVITRRVGSLGNAVNLSGRVDTHGWNDEDYLEWGVRFMLANNGREIDSEVFEVLSPVRRAPARTSIPSHFGSMEDFREEVRPRYADEKERLDGAHRASFRRAMVDFAKGEIPPRLLIKAETETDVRSLTAKYRVVRDFFPGLNENDTIEVANRVNSGFSRSVIRLSNGTLHGGDIEQTAITLDVYDDIWPMDEYRNTLKMPEAA